ncbi:hypothetical protein EJB05_13118, partial [Eragrostis curvula]
RRVRNPLSSALTHGGPNVKAGQHTFLKNLGPSSLSPVAMASSGDPVAVVRAKQLKVLMPPSFHKLRISDELAGCFDTAAGEGATALVVSPFGKVWRVEVGRDGEGAFLGRGWADFLAAHGIGVGWFVVLRHEGGGALTVKAFDTSFCIKEFGAPAAVMSPRNSKEVSCKPQFIRVIHQDFLEKMIIPAKFLKHYVSEGYLNSRVVVLVSPLGKFWRIELEKNQSGMFLAGGWPEFLAFHAICEGDVLLFRHEGNMVFKFKVFGLDGGQKYLKNRDTEILQMTDTLKQHESPCPMRKLGSNSEGSSYEGKKRPKSSMTSLNKTPRKESDYHIGPPSWIKKKITPYMLQRLLSLSVKFCHSVGFRAACTITLKTEMESIKSWLVRGLAYEKVCYLLGEGWVTFCQDNKINKGDICTFNVMGTTLWHVIITRYTQEGKESPCSFSREGESKKGMPISGGDNQLKGSMSVLNKASSTYTRSVYEIGPPSWIQKKITPNSLKQYHLCLAHDFFYAVGLREPSTLIKLKTSINSARSWQVCGLMKKDNSYYLGSGWKKFVEENKLKVGDVCTFNIVEATLWHVVITRR